MDPGKVELETSPQQPPAVVSAVAAVLEAAGEHRVDPWWRAGIEEALET